MISRLCEVLVVLALSASTLQAQWLDCGQLSSLGEKVAAGISDRQLALHLKKAERDVLAQPAEDQAACLKWLADLYRDMGNHRAEHLYQQAVNLAPENPEVLEAIASYYRTYRGTKGLFAEAETYYVRAEQAVETALAALADTSLRPYLDEMRERVRRGRIELNKREGLGLVIPHRPGQKLGLYLGSTLDDGGFPVAHNDLATPANTLLNRNPRFNTADMVREQDLSRRRTVLRFRAGELPYLDLAWFTVDGTNVIASQTLPVTFADLEVDEFELALEDTVNMAPVDLLWRVELHHGTFDVEGPAEESFDRIVASTTWTRSFGRVKADLQVLSGSATIEHEYGGTDHDRVAAANLRLLHFRPRETTKNRPIDPRGFEYFFGYVTHAREFGDDVELVQETFFAGLKLTELLARTDLEILPSFFRNVVRGKTGEDSSNLEANLILTHRLIDRVNDLGKRQADQPLGLAQWAVNLRLFEELPTEGIDDFESRGLVASSFVEIFSSPMNRSTLILEAAYEIREYQRLGERQHLARFGLRFGF